MATEKNTKKGKRTKELKTRQIVAINNILSRVNILGLDKDTQIAILRIGMIVKPHAQAFDEYQKDAVNRLKPQDYDQLEEKQSQLDTLPPEERASVTAAITAFNRSILPILDAQLDKTVTLQYDAIPVLSLESVAEIGSNNKIPVSELLLIHEATV